MATVNQIWLEGERGGERALNTAWIGIQSLFPGLFMQSLPACLVFFSLANLNIYGRAE